MIFQKNTSKIYKALFKYCYVNKYNTAITTTTTTTTTTNNNNNYNNNFLFKIERYITTKRNRLSINLDSMRIYDRLEHCYISLSY